MALRFHHFSEDGPTYSNGPLWELVQWRSLWVALLVMALAGMIVFAIRGEPEWLIVVAAVLLGARHGARSR